MIPRPGQTSADGESLRALFSRLVEDGTQFVRAEINYYKQMALHRAADVKVALIFGVAALFLAGSALTTLLIGLGVALASWLGVAGGVIAVAVLALLVAALLGWQAAKRFGEAASGGSEAAAAREIGREISK